MTAEAPTASKAVCINEPAYTTLNKIRSFNPCASGWEKLLRSLGKTQADDEPLAFSRILESNGLDDALWCLRTIVESDRERLWEFCASVTERGMDRFEAWAKEHAPEHAGAVRTVVDGLRSGAFADPSAADAAWSAAWSAADAAWSADAAAWSAAWSAAAAAWSARSADAAWSADAAAWSARSAREFQAKKLIQIFG
jgi:hypothetical protein